MRTDIHAASNAVINKYLDKEVTLVLNRGQINDLAILVADTLNDENEVLTNDARLYLMNIHRKLLQA